MKNEYIIIAEKKILRALFDKWNPTFNKNVWVSQEALQIFEACSNLVEMDLELTPILIAQESNKTNPSLTLPLISDIFETEVPTSKEYSYQMEVLTTTEEKNHVKKIFSDIQEVLEQKGPLYKEDISEYMSQVNSTLSGFSKIASKSYSEMSDTYLETMEERKNGIMPSIGDPIHLDKALLRKASGGQIIMIAGATGTGKSIFATNLVNGLLNLEQPILWFSLEMDEESSFDRLISRRTSIPVREFYNRELIDNLKQSVEREKKLLANNKKFKFVSNPKININDLELQAMAFRSELNLTLDQPITMLVDLITQVEEFNKVMGGNSVATSYELGMNQLNRVAKQHNLCIIAVAQMGRSADKLKFEKLEDIEKARPSLNDVKNSNALAERSRVVLGLFRAKYYIDRYLPNIPEASSIEDILEVQVLKQSMGVNGNILKYYFEGETSTTTPYKEVVTEEERITAGISY